MTMKVLAVLLAAAATAFLPAAVAGTRLTTLHVPSSSFPTIQSAIDAAPDGSEIHIKPGIYRETLFVRGKRLQIMGSQEKGGAVLVGNRPREVGPVGEAVGLMNYEGAGGGLLRHLRFHGGDAAVVGRGDARNAGLEIRDVEVSGSGRGIVWASAGTLTVKHATIQATTGNGLVLVKGTVYSDKFIVLDAGEVGCYVANAQAHFNDALVAGNNSVGYYIFNSHVTITGGLIANNNVAGIWAVSSTLAVDSTSIYSNHADPATNRFGDGVAVLLGQAELTGLVVGSNEQCGISNFGANVKVTDNLLQNNLFHVCGASLSAGKLAPGEPAQDTDFTYDDGGGNHCFGQGGAICNITTPGVEPPAPLPAP